MLASLQEDPYQVRIPAFEGPLDLLLQLIEREAGHQQHLTGPGGRSVPGLRPRAGADRC